jgi:hypothetical protein
MFKKQPDTLVIDHTSKVIFDATSGYTDALNSVGAMVIVIGVSGVTKVIGGKLVDGFNTRSKIKLCNKLGVPVPEEASDEAAKPEKKKFLKKK